MRLPRLPPLAPGCQRIRGVGRAGDVLRDKDPRGQRGVSEYYYLPDTALRVSLYAGDGGICDGGMAV